MELEAEYMDQRRILQGMIEKYVYEANLATKVQYKPIY
jgi:hypothetical protein